MSDSEGEGASQYRRPIKREEVQVEGPVMLGKIADVDPFEGEADGMEVDEWISHFEIAAEANGWNDGLKKKVAPCYFKNDALDWYRGIEVDQRKGFSWSALKEEMLNEFRPAGYELNLRMQLRNIVQEEGMSVKDYAKSLKKLFTKLPKMPAEEKLDKFLSGLDVYFMKKIIRLKPVTWEEALRDALAASPALGAPACMPAAWTATPP